MSNQPNHQTIRTPADMAVTVTRDSTGTISEIGVRFYDGSSTVFSAAEWADMRAVTDQVR